MVSEMYTNANQKVHKFKSDKVHKQKRISVMERGLPLSTFEMSLEESLL